MTNRSAGSRFLLRLAVMAIVGGVPFVARTAGAQQWLADRRVSDGKGVTAGDIELHPGAGAEIGFDSNYFLRTSNTGAPGRLLINGANNPATAGDHPPLEAVILRLTPSLTLNTRSTAPPTEAAATTLPTLAPFYFSAAIAATYSEFFGKGEVTDQRNLSGNANARLDVNRGRPVGFDVYAGYQRLIQPNIAGNPDLSFNRSNVNAGGDIVFTPGGGTLDLRAGYQIAASLFEETEGVPFSNITHELSFRDRWRFRPRTALFHDTTLRFVSYPNADRSVAYLNDSTPLRTRVGVTGLITDSLGTLVAAGYGATFFQDAASPASTQYDSINAQAELTLYLSQNPGASEPGQATLLLSTVTAGFIRDFQQSLLSNFYTSNKGYLKFNYFFGPKAIIQLSGEFGDLEYPNVFVNGAAGAPVQSTGEFTNLQLGLLAFAEYRLLDSLGINTTLRYDQMFSSTLLPEGALPGGPAANQFYDMSWKRFQAFLGVRWFL